MNVTCSAEPCPVILNATCVFYEGNTLVYTGIVTNDNLQTALQKIDQKFQDSNLGYIFTNGIEQLAPGQPVMLGGALVKDTTIGGLYNLAFAGTLEASALITTGGTSTDFVKGDGSLDPTSYQPAGNYITNLTGDVLASGPGSVAATLATVFGAPGTYGNSGNVPAITVDGKGRVTNVTPIPINYPAQSLSFIGDVEGLGFTGSPVTLTLDTVNTDVYGSNNFLKFAVNGKGLITSATPVSDGDITTALGYVPVDNAIELSINGVAHDLTASRSWNVGTVTGVSIIAGTGLNASISNPNTTPSISIVNTAPDQTVVLTGGFGISVTGSYPNFTVTNDYPSLGGTVTSFSAGNLSPLFTTSVTNSTTTPALSFALSSAAANTVLAGPNGGAGTPTYRALVAADIPSLQYISSISVTGPLATTGGLTPTLSISQANSTTDGYLSSTDWNIFNNKTTCTGTVTNVAVCSSTTGVSVSGSPITTSGTIGVDISTASAACTGLLSSTDWNTFNDKQDALGYTPVPDSRQLNINGTTYDLTADRCWSVGTVTSVATSAPLTGGTITNSGTIGITQAGAGSDGYLSSADWNTFNDKQASGNYITDLTGDATASGPGSVALTLATVNATTGTFGSSTQVPVITVNGKGLVTCVTTDTISGSLEFVGDVTGVGSTGTCTTLTLATVNNDVYTSETLLNVAVNGKGLITSANPTTAGDICSTLGYTPENVANKSTSTSLGTSNTLYPTQLAVKTYVDSATAGGIILQGNWNAATNTPNISGTTTTGWAWRVDVAGTTNLGGITDWQVGDLAVKAATGWVKIDNTENVTSVFGRFGAIVATTGDYLTCQVTECGNLYYTDARVRAAVGHTAPLTYNSTTGVFGITQSNATTDGYLSATDWNTFNDKQPLIAAGTTSQYYRGDKTFQTLDTSVVTEGSNLYFTDARARGAVCAASGVAYNSTTGQFTNSCPDQIVSLTGGGTTSITGTYPNFCITSSDCFTGTVTSVSVTGTNIGVTGSPITSAGTIGLSLSAANVCDALGFSPYNSTNPAGYTTCTGTVTSVATSTSTTGVLLSGSPVTTSGTLGIDISTASATCTGLLTAADWNTFNSKTSCLGTVTNVAACTSTTGVSITGSPITSSGTLGINISTASSVCTGLLTAADWNTFNSHTACTGTVTSVGLTSSTTGVSIGGSPITSSGNLSLNIATASSLCTGLLTAADWNSFNSRTSCTGTVTCVNATGTNISVTGGPITTSGTLGISLSGANVCSALGYTPYNATNPNGYTTCIGTVTSVGVVATNINVCNSPVTTSGNICLNLTAANVCSALGFSPAPSSALSSYLPLAGGTLTGVLQIGTSVYTTSWNDGSGSYVEFVGNSTATRKLRLQGDNGSGSYAQWFIDGGNQQIYGSVGGYTNLLMNSSTVFLRYNGSDKFWTGSDGVRVQGWTYYQDNGAGVHWPNNGWHIYPKDGSDMYVRSGSSDASIQFIRGGTPANYIHNASDNAIGFLSTGRSWIFRVDNGGSATAYGDMRAPIFYDSQDTTYYLDPNSSGKSLNIAGNIDLIARSASWAEGIRVRVPSTSTWGGIRFTRDRGDNDGNWAIGYTGINSSDDLTFWANNGGDGGSFKLQMDKAGNSTFQTSVRAPIFYDSNDTGYYLDPNGTSNLYKFSEFTMAYNGMNPMSANSPYAARYAGSANYRNGTMGNGNTDFNVMFSNWGSGFIDSWSYPANAPGGSSHYVGLQGFHYNYQNGSQAYGFQMACAGEADNRFFWRSAWPNLRSWVEMIHSGNISSQTVSNSDMVDGYHVSVGGSANTIPTRNGSGYLIPENWIQLNGIYGLYSPTNNAHLRPNNGSYGSWLMTGSRNGWQGIEFDSGGAGNVTMMIHTDSNTVGFHNNSYGWQIRWANGTLYCGKNSYGGNDATVWDSVNAPRASNSNLVYYAGFTLNANTMPTNSTGFTYSDGAPTTGPIVRFGDGGYDLQFNAYYYWGDQLYYRTRNGDTGNWNNWYTIITSSNIGSQSVAYASSAGSVGQANNATSLGFSCVSGGDTFYVQTSCNPGFGSGNPALIATSSNPYSSRSIFNANDVSTYTYDSYYYTSATPYGYNVNFGNYYSGGGYGSCSFTSQGINGYDSYGGSVQHNPYILNASNGGGYNFNWNGYSGGNLYIGGVIYQNQGSDAKLKDNIVPIPNALDKVKAIRGVEFDWNELAFEHSGKEGHDVGVIAQEVQAVYPFAVREHNREAEDRVYSHLVVDYDKLNPLAIQAINELAAIVDELKLEIQTLKSQINGSNI